MQYGWFQDYWIILALPISVVLLFLWYELGYWIGRRLSADHKPLPDSFVTTIEAAALGLLALLIAFSFSLAEYRFERRTDLVLEEANAIGTTALRARLLPEPQAQEVGRLLRDYVALRATLSDADEAEFQRALEKSEQLHEALWREAIAISRLDSHSPVYALFIQSLNEMIDLHAERLMQFRNHVPDAVIAVLYLVAFITNGLAGYANGLSGPRILTLVLGFSTMIAMAIILVVDLDRSHQGLIRVNQQPLIDLERTLEAGGA